MAHKVLLALDLDRTLTREAATSKTLASACAALGIDTTLMKKAQAETEAAGESFFELEYLRNNLPPDISIDQVELEFKRVAKDTSLLYDDILPFIEAIEKRKVPIIIVTYGEHSWQTLKIEATDLHNHPYIITDQKVKGSLVASWKTRDIYLPTGFDASLAAERVVLVDDKAKSFELLPDDCQGYLIRRPNETILPSQMGNVPSNVAVVADFTAILESLTAEGLI